MKKKTVTVETLLKKARSFLMNHKWIQNKESDGHGGYCAIGCLSRAVAELSGSTLKHDQAVERLDKVAGVDFSNDIVEFNDAEGTTKLDVKHAFTRAIYRHY